MTTLTATYCAFCDALRNFGKRFIRALERSGTRRAAEELARMGYHKEAREILKREASN